MNSKLTVRLPAEWEPQSAILLTWPHNMADWHTHLPEVEKVFLEIAYHVTQVQSLIVCCFDEQHKKYIERQFITRNIDVDNCHFFIVPSNDSWARDHGPVTVLEDGKPLLLNFTFDGWGKKYPADLDNAISRHLHRAGAFADIPVKDIDLVFEGGNLESDGQGSILASQRCLFSVQRNPDLTPAEIENRLKQATGADRLLVLKSGQISGDDTDGHIDTLARFINQKTIAYVTCDDTKHPDYAELKAMESELKAFTQLNGKPYTLIKLPSPALMINENHEPLPTSYANYLVINGAVLVPIYEDKEDEIALEILGNCFPDRNIIGIDCRALTRQFGSLHCVTMHISSGHISSGHIAAGNLSSDRQA